MTDIDTKLNALFAVPPTPPDEKFVKRVDAAVMAEQRMQAARVAMWRRFAVELAGTIAVVAAFHLLWEMAPNDIDIGPLMHAPGIAASMLLFLWLGVQQRQSAAPR